jgi:hypothetical protein
MKYTSLKLGLSLLVLSHLVSCTKIIDVDLNSANPTLIVEGEITDKAGPYEIKLSKTVNFSQGNIFPGVTGAQVTVSDGTIVDTLIETVGGIYKTRKLVGRPEKTYSLKIIAEGKTYTSSSKMPAAIPILGAFVEISSINLPGDTVKSYDYFVVFTDPPNIQNNYRFIFSSKGIKDKGFNDIVNDNLFDGKPFPFPGFTTQDFNKTLKSNDVVNIEMQCIDRNVFNYFSSLSNNLNGQSATPANPVNNISGGALGYFSACSINKTSVVIP